MKTQYVFTIVSAQTSAGVCSHVECRKVGEVEARPSDNPEGRLGPGKFADNEIIDAFVNCVEDVG